VSHARWFLVVLALSVVITYANSLHGVFFLDDIATVQDNPSVHDWTHLRDLFIPTEETPLAGRPLVALSFVLNYVVGGEDVRGYHLWNIGVHLTTALLLFGVVRRTLELPRLRGRVGGSARSTAFCVALLWAVHPLNTEAVNYLTQRTETMMGLFYVATIYASIRGLNESGWAWSATAVASCAAGMACKESMVTAPLAVVLFDRVFVFDSMRKAVHLRWRLYVGLAATWGLLVVLRVLEPFSRSAGFSTGVGVWTYLLNQTVMISRYLRLTVWPTSLVVNYGWPLPLHVSDVWPQAMLVLTLLVATLVAMWKRPAAGFAGAWFFLTLAPTSSFMPIATEVGAERRMYVPLMSLTALAVVGVAVAWQARRDALVTLARSTPRWENVAGWTTVAAIALAFTIGTMARNREYRSGLTLAASAVARWPSSVGEHELGTEWLAAGNTSEALSHFRRAIPGAPRAYYSLAVTEFEQEQWDAAIRDFRAFLQAQPFLVEAISARLYLGRALSYQLRWADAIEQGRLVLTMNPARDEALDGRLLIAEGLRAQQEFEAAASQYQIYVEARPTDVRGVTGLAISLVGLKRPEDAAGWFTKAADLTPNDPATQRNAAMALFELGRADAAAVYAERAARLRPDDGVAHDVFGQILFSQQRVPAAIEQFQMAHRLNPNDAETRAHLEQAERWSRVHLR
jgi:protein O-mannosyl-transferase